MCLEEAGRGTYGGRPRVESAASYIVTIDSVTSYCFVATEIFWLDLVF